jgi:hypothetical protein
MAADDIVWQDPPEHVGRPAEFVHLVQALDANPGRWAVVPTGDRTAMQCTRLANNILRGRNAAFRPADAYEVRQVRDTLYARRKI